jgi:uncharacterized protein YdeI (BOF family)
MNKKHYIAIVLVVLVLVGALITYAVRKNSVPTTQQQNNTVYQGEKTSEEEPIIITGTIGCLKPKDTGQPVDMSCAIGVRQDDGKSYALSSEDPSLTGSVPSGQKVRVTGTFSKKTSQYDIEGVIKVSSLERL